MFTYYCPKCKKECDYDKEIELIEVGMEHGDWQEHHTECGSLVKVYFNKETIKE